VIRESVDVRYELRAPGARGGSTNSALKGNTQAAVAALVRTDAEHLVADHAVEAGPVEVRERFVQRRGTGGEDDDPVALTLQQQVELALHVGVALGARFFARAGRQLNRGFHFRAPNPERWYTYCVAARYCRWGNAPTALRNLARSRRARATAINNPC
jgi:hypothetical protein